MPAPKVWPSDQSWNLAALFDQKEPDLIIRSTPYLMKARANDAWWKPVVETGLTEARWVRAIEIRPGTVKGRKITHHAIARLQQEEDQPGLQNADQGDSFRNAGTFMEWAVGKQGEIMRPNTGKLMLPGSKIIWDIHYSATGEDVNDVVELGHLLLSQGTGAEVPADAAPDGIRRHRHPAQHGEDDRRVLPPSAERPRGKLPAAHAPARQGDGHGSDPSKRPDAGPEPRGQLQLQLAQQLRLHR